MANVDSDTWEFPARQTSPGKPFLCRGKITATPVTADVWRWFKVPANSRLVNAWFRNAGTSTAVPGNIIDNLESPTTYVTDIDFEDASGFTQIAVGLGTVYTAETQITTLIGTVDTGGETTGEVFFLMENL
jgi:hypothetical protein